jgi:hypothetical protein
VLRNGRALGLPRAALHLLCGVVVGPLSHGDGVVEDGVPCVDVSYLRVRVPSEPELRRRADVPMVVSGVQAV